MGPLTGGARKPTSPMSPVKLFPPRHKLVSAEGQAGGWGETQCTHRESG